jgi:hypothetical protein
MMKPNVDSFERVNTGKRDSVQTAKQATHTPGPWVAQLTRSGSWCIDHRSGSYADAVASCFDAPEAATNALLIAAAPDLLAVARMVVEWDGPGGTDSPMAVAARAAVAKATGAP